MEKNNPINERENEENQRKKCAIETEMKKSNAECPFALLKFDVDRHSRNRSKDLLRTSII